MLFSNITNCISNNIQQCTIICSGYRSCYGSIFWCNAKQSCILRCTGEESCFHSKYYSLNSNVSTTIHGVQNRSCSLMEIYHYGQELFCFFTAHYSGYDTSSVLRSLCFSSHHPKAYQFTVNHMSKYKH